MTALIAGVSLVRSGPGELGLWMVPVSFEEQKADTKSDACAEKKEQRRTAKRDQTTLLQEKMTKLVLFQDSYLQQRVTLRTRHQEPN